MLSFYAIIGPQACKINSILKKLSKNRSIRKWDTVAEKIIILRNNDITKPFKSLEKVKINSDNSYFFSFTVFKDC